MNVNSKGEAGLIEVIRDLQRKGYECFLPFGDSSAVDLIAVDGNYKPYRLQVKYRSLVRGSIEVNYHSMVNSKQRPINFDAIDGWAVYCPDVDSVVYVGKHDVDLTKRNFYFRLFEATVPPNKDKTRRKLYTEFGELSDWP